MDDVMRYQRTASAPWSPMACQGSAMLPRDFDIFNPSASRIRSLTRTFRYGGSSLPSRVEMASKE